MSGSDGSTDHDEPEYLLTLNVYRVSGITNGLRAEWSTYIADPDGTTVELRSYR